MRHCDPGVGTPEDDLAQVVGVLFSNHAEIKKAEMETKPLPFPDGIGMVCEARLKVRGVPGIYRIWVRKLRGEND